MSDVMLLGVLRMPMPDNPADMGGLEWAQVKDRMRQAADEIEKERAAVDGHIRLIEVLEDEVARLRAELAAERDKTADYGKQINWLADKVVAQEKAIEATEAERDELRAELAAERQENEWHRVSKKEQANVINSLVDERDGLRDLLLEAYEWRDTLWPVSTTVRIAAALNKGGDRD